ncbi:sulfite exporter TauE/SafE family protein [Algoriphagus boritolerans]
MSIILKLILGVITGIFGYYYITDVFRNRKTFSGKPWSGLLGTGFITNFFDTLGIGSFAQQTAIFKFFKLVDDRLIPGTMNVGNTIPVVIQAFIFMTVVEVDTLTLVSMSIVAPLGALLGADIVSKMSRSRIQIGLGFGLLAVGLIMIAGFFNLMPTGGEA